MNLTNHAIRNLDQAVRHGTQNSILFRLLIAIMVSCLVGCASPKINWNKRVGSYTFDQAVIELGPPDKQATLTDGTRVADWLTRRGGIQRTVVGPYGYGPYGYAPGYPSYLDYAVPDYFLRLVFDPDGNLIDWKKFARY